MEVSDAQRVFQTSEYKDAVSRGPVIALLCLGSGITEACSRVRLFMFIFGTLFHNGIMLSLKYYIEEFLFFSNVRILTHDVKNSTNVRHVQPR